MQHLLEQLNTAVTTFINSDNIWTAFWAVFLLMLLESACIPVPSEVTMLYAGYLVYLHPHHSLAVWFVAMITAGVVGNIVGSLITWAIGRSGGRSFLEKHGRWLHASQRSLDRSDAWFARYGARTVLLTRMMPIVRTFISLPAGVARMPLGRFTLYTTLGCVPWVAALTYIGWLLGPKWDKAHQVLRYGDYLVVAAVVAAVGYFLLKRRRRKSTAAASDSTPA